MDKQPRHDMKTSGKLEIIPVDKTLRMHATMSTRVRVTVKPIAKDANRHQDAQPQ